MVKEDQHKESCFKTILPVFFFIIPLLIHWTMLIFYSNYFDSMAKTRGKQHLYGWILWNRGHQWNCYILNSVERLASAVLRFLGFQYFRIVWQRLLRLVLYLLTLRFGGGSGKVGAGVKRKTPSELRGEQLKQRNVIELVDESPAPLLGSTKNTIELKKQDAFEVPRCIDTRMDGVFPAKKSRFRMLSGKENAKLRQLAA
ncbi:uncharacterized protein LOC104877384 isoform X2 [Vitis vinifera]|uniref:uncharacterized protein LOC104877384 isoform X2 n=1 Tax=Vitis vinifera TaxID=29760 RepID=UPI002883036F|nr:uncharacterized protein LOC104877384 isoform X2 [Vitis vinifera]